jgi:hypothetical protein
VGSLQQAIRQAAWRLAIPDRRTIGRCARGVGACRAQLESQAIARTGQPSVLPPAVRSSRIDISAGSPMRGRGDAQIALRRRRGEPA